MNSSISTTIPNEIGELAAESIREITMQAARRSNISTFAETESPLSWTALADGGWDLIGVLEDGEGATLRDLVEVARVWGETCIPLPFIPSIMAKRHSQRARESDGPVTVALPNPSSPRGYSYIPFGHVDGITIALGLGRGADELIAVPPGSDDELGLMNRAIEGPVASALSPAAAREYAVVLAAEASGAAKRLLAEGVAFVKERQQFGKPIGSFQAVKHILANALIDVELAETAVISASFEEQNAFRNALFAVDRSIQAAEGVIQSHGGLGFTWEMGLHFYLRQMLMARELISGLSALNA
ncbi:acyl-CoA dehydrogenase [Cryobacterium sp. TMS1-20-1]|uniref:acyl-CoA dehydrogenase family protein n=1 Tax=Cryobacterium sp. TMS1-20-1 TaxID=1259223 RepID=UPI00106CBF27|nr:acyl-CoA dehydrogenase family protein [Cryobacterium sp. TMS1-20-1]TFC74893.1 acyl-CoA dehydrogenase [Cryobacterium sp. TMS1-20-1]